MKFFYIYILLFLKIYTTHSQNNLKNYYTYFDNVVGLKNTNLSYGIIFKEKYRTLNGNHHYFNVDKFKTGTVNYNNELFFDVPLKYDIEADELIVNIVDEFETYSIVLEKSFVKKFSIQNNQFINLVSFGFNEVLYNSNTISLYKKHKKRKKKMLDKSLLYYKFIEQNSYLIYFNKTYYTILKNRKDIMKIFPDHKQFIKSYFKENNSILKTNLDLFLIQLIKKLNNKLLE